MVPGPGEDPAEVPARGAAEPHGAPLPASQAPPPWLAGRAVADASRVMVAPDFVLAAPEQTLLGSALPEPGLPGSPAAAGAPERDVLPPMLQQLVPSAFLLLLALRAQWPWQLPPSPVFPSPQPPSQQPVQPSSS